MKTNGHIAIEDFARDEYDENGELVAVQRSSHVQIPCYIQTLTDNRFGRNEGGVFHQMAFRILIERDAYEGMPYDLQRVSLERNGIGFGTFRVQSFELLPEVGRIEILV